MSVLFFNVLRAKEKELKVMSPDGRTEVEIILNDKLQYAIHKDGKTLILPSSIGMILTQDGMLGASPKLVMKSTATVDREVKTAYGPTDLIREKYNELLLSFKGSYQVCFRVYDNGVAYRFITKLKKNIQVKDEIASFAFTGDHEGFYISGPKKSYLYEDVYHQDRISKIDSGGHVASLPMVVRAPGIGTITLAESDLDDYPGMYIAASGSRLSGTYRNYPTKTNLDDKVRWAVRVQESDSVIAKTSGTRSFPWRIIGIDNDDKSLFTNYLVYLLAEPQKKDIDFSWVKPGNIVNDWWEMVAGEPQKMILTGVDFKSGTNLKSYKYNIDFAVKNNIDYVNMDYGWSDIHDFSKINPDLDLEGVISYSKQKKKPLMLWCLAKTLYSNLEENMAMFQRWGIAGLKVDFFERDDQLGIRDYYQIAESAARHHLMLEYHGSTNPAGLNRTFPNILTFESVYASEQVMTGKRLTPRHNVTMPFIRSFSGPFDYLPGTLRNVNEANFHASLGLKMTMGTRANQAAMFIIYYSPLQFLVDMASNYEKDTAFTNFIIHIPTTWDSTVAISGEVGESVMLARRKGNAWFVGAMTNWTPRELELPTGFLEKRKYRIEILEDGPNAELNGIDYVIESKEFSGGEPMKISLASGGGWVARFTPL